MISLPPSEHAVELLPEVAWLCTALPLSRLGSTTQSSTHPLHDRPQLAIPGQCHSAYIACVTTPSRTEYSRLAREYDGAVALASADNERCGREREQGHDYAHPPRFVNFEATSDDQRMKQSMTLDSWPSHQWFSIRERFSVTPTTGSLARQRSKFNDTVVVVFSNGLKCHHVYVGKGYAARRYDPTETDGQGAS